MRLEGEGPLGIYHRRMPETRFDIRSLGDRTRASLSRWQRPYHWASAQFHIGPPSILYILFSKIVMEPRLLHRVMHTIFYYLSCKIQHPKNLDPKKPSLFTIFLKTPRSTRLSQFHPHVIHTSYSSQSNKWTHKVHHYVEIPVITHHGKLMSCRLSDRSIKDSRKDQWQQPHSQPQMVATYSPH
jgi:hypothetical protein